jgi:hypothetical protein
MASSHAHPAAGGAAAGSSETSLETAEDAPGRDHPRYCPTQLLATFTLLMAGHGRCVHADMMLGDREYAMWQLACAQAIDDPELADVAARLFAYFDDPQHSGMPVLGTA